jgi:pimeloyl-ACP methyl ester carboxylesterase
VKLAQILILILLSAILHSAYGSEAGSTPPVGSAKLTQAVCSQIPNSKSISVKLQNNQPKLGRFNLFFFTVEKFDSAKPSILYVEGGPGFVRIKPYELHKKILKDYNVVYFHIRGAGCSQIPQGEVFDKYLNSFRVAEDMESIRKNLEIKAWKAVYGASYGTTAARVYARFYPNATQMLILDGPTATFSDRSIDPAAVLKSGLDKIVELEESTTLNSMSDLELYGLKEKILTMAHRYYVSTGISNPMAMFTSIIFSGDQNGKYDFGGSLVSPEYLYALTLLSSWGVNEPNHRKIIAQLLFGEFAPKIKADFLTEAHIAWLQRSYRLEFPTLYKNTADVKIESFKSDRALNSVSYFDQSIDNSFMCSAVPIYAVNGGLDLYTPVTSAKEKLENKECYKGDVRYLVINGAGHSVFLTDPQGEHLLSDAVQFIDNPAIGTPSPVLANAH